MVKNSSSDNAATHGAPPGSAAERATARPAAGPTAVVLELSKRGREELERPRFGLHGHQRRLLEQVDGRRALSDCADADPRLQPARLARDAARLVAFGLARPVRGELPPELMAQAMNLTARIPIESLPPLEPERTVSPMQPRVATTRGRHSQTSRHSPPGEDRPPAEPERPRWPVVWLAALVALAVGAIGYFA